MKYLRYSLFTLTLSLVLFSCKKEDIVKAVNPDCETKRYGIVKVKSESKNKYNVTIGLSHKFDLPGYSSDSRNVSEGTVVITATQLEGYVIYPSVYKETVTVNPCGSYSWTFPD